MIMITIIMPIYVYMYVCVCVCVCCPSRGPNGLVQKGSLKKQVHPNVPPKRSRFSEVCHSSPPRGCAFFRGRPFGLLLFQPKGPQPFGVVCLLEGALFGAFFLGNQTNTTMVLDPPTLTHTHLGLGALFYPRRNGPVQLPRSDRSRVKSGSGS